MFEVLPVTLSLVPDPLSGQTHASTFENSGDGDTTKLSFEADHEIR